MRHHVPRKRFGQNFLHDKQIIQRLVDVIAPVAGQHFIEIGPGQGALTVPLLKMLGELTVIEIDRDLIPSLIARCANKGTLHVHEADVLEVDFSSVIKSFNKVRFVGNLPYNISTPLIFHLLKYAPFILDMHFMLQKEVVDRLAASPGCSDYGRLSIMAQYHCQVTALFYVPPSAFYPPPQVDSNIVRFVPYPEVPYRALDYNHFSMIVKHAFAHRRKTLRNNLKDLITEAGWQSLKIDPNLRAERLTVEDFVNISNQLVDDHSCLSMP